MRSTFRVAGSSNWLKSTLSVVCLSAGLFMTQAASATIVQFQTVLGDFEVNLFDQTTPKTVENFLAYVNAQAYTNTFIHRSVPTFIVQGGGYTFNEKLGSITQNPKVVNEPVYSNVRGTIAMAKLGNDANSATNQWFFNLADNSENLDKQNGGFTVFGQVTDSGMRIVDEIAKLNRFNMTSPFDSIPLRNYTTADNANKVDPGNEHFVLIENIVVLNADQDTAASLNPTKNTLINEKSGGGGGGSLGLLSLLALGLVALGRKSLLNKG